jgi:type III secretion protein C
MKFCLRRVLVPFIIGICACSASAYNFSGTYSHYSAGENVKDTLNDFGRSMGMGTVISSKISGEMSGRFEDINPNVFLDGLRAAFGVRYYTLDKTINFYHESEWKQKIVNTGSPEEAANLLDACKKSGMVPVELPITLKGNMLTLQGPQPLIDSLSDIMASVDNSVLYKPVMTVFKLKHAKADDTEVKSTNKTIIIPGVASILNKMVTGDSKGGSIQSSTPSATIDKLRGTGLAAQGKDNTNDKSNNNTSVSNMSQNSGQQSRISITADSRLNAVVINDSAYKIPYYKKVIQELDQPVKLVELHAAIVDVDIGAAKELGVAWQGSRTAGKWSFGAGVGNSSNLSWSGSPNLISNTNDGGVFSTLFKSSASLFMAQINLLESDSKARTLGRPSVLTMDNIEATLEDTTTRYVKVSGYQDVDLFKVESGTILQVTPHIIDDKKTGIPSISMVVKVQSNQDSSDSLSNSSDPDTVPPIKQTTINTRALVREGQSLLLGGYYVEYKQEGNSGVPGLRNVPVVGKVFGSDSNNAYRRERLILITPRIVGLEDVQSLPSHLDNPEFEMSPTQANYLHRPAKQRESSGCSSSRSTISLPSSSTK